MISEIFGGNIVSAIDGTKPSSVLVREFCDNPAITPFWKVIFNHPESEKTLFCTVSSSSPLLHLILSPENLTEENSSAASIQFSGDLGTMPVYSNPSFQEKNQCPDFACSSQANILNL